MVLFLGEQQECPQERWRGTHMNRGVVVMLLTGGGIIFLLSIMLVHNWPAAGMLMIAFPLWLVEMARTRH